MVGDHRPGLHFDYEFAYAVMLESGHRQEAPSEEEVMLIKILSLPFALSLALLMPAAAGAQERYPAEPDLVEIMFIQESAVRLVGGVLVDHSGLDAIAGVEELLFLRPHEWERLIPRPRGRPGRTRNRGRARLGPGSVQPEQRLHPAFPGAAARSLAGRRRSRRVAGHPSGTARAPAAGTAPAAALHVPAGLPESRLVAARGRRGRLRRLDLPRRQRCGRDGLRPRVRLELQPPGRDPGRRLADQLQRRRSLRHVPSTPARGTAPP